MLRIVENAHLTETVEDWSAVRSPSRALRRRRKHRQNIRFVQVAQKGGVVRGGTIYMHPETAAAVRAQLDRFSKQWTR